MRSLPASLLAVTERSSVAPPDLAARQLLGTLEGLMRGGVRWVWFRERDLAPDERRALARDVVDLVGARGGFVSIGGDPALARDLGAEGVHLPGGATPVDVASARERLPHGCLGVSAHSLAEVEAAARAGADYVTLSPIFATASKPGYGPALGPQALAAAGAFGIPVIALGGMTPDRVGLCREAGAAGIAVMGGLMRSPDPEAEARAYGASLDVRSGRGGSGRG
ncbi:thiamine monophosphate synthase [Methylobacterium sp. Leaf117]|nr:thiamine monophosphate synthase [Methylobacterium sp. Leaf117]